MAGLFSKGGVPLTPAQQQLQQAALQGSENFSKVWQPVQSFFANQVNAGAPGLKQQGINQAAATSRTQGFGAEQRRLGMDSARGAAAGFGAFLSDLARGSTATAGLSGMSEAGAAAAGDAHYVQGLQQVLGMYQADQGQAMRGLQTAARAQAQEAGAAQQAAAENAQGAGQLAGLAIAAA